MRRLRRSRKPPARRPSAGEPPADTPRAAEPPADAPQAAEPPADTPQAAEPPADTPGAGQPEVDELEASEPESGEPQVGQPPAFDSKETSRDRRHLPDRRSGGDRREPGDRRSGQDRRMSRDRRVQNLGPPPGVPERRSGIDRRRGERRSGRDRRDETGWAAVSLDSIAVEPFPLEHLLVDAACTARERARARYSGLRVGAALESVDGRIITGCNVENASFGLTMCAERVALLKALSDGHEIFTRIAIVVDTEQPTPPCGPCRQLLWEYCGDIQVILASPHEVKRRYLLGRLLPVPFDHRLLR